MPEIWPGKCSSCKKMALDFPSFSPGVVPLWAWPKEAYCAPGIDSLNHTNSCMWNECYGWASLYSTSFLDLIFYHLLFMGCFKLISILGKSWTLSIILVVALLFLANSAQSFNRGSGEGYNTFRVCERPYLPSKWRFPDTPTLFSYALKSLMRN